MCNANSNLNVRGVRVCVCACMRVRSQNVRHNSIGHIPTPETACTVVAIRPKPFLLVDFLMRISVRPFCWFIEHQIHILHCQRIKVVYQLNYIYIRVCLLFRCARVRAHEILSQLDELKADPPLPRLTFLTLIIKRWCAPPATVLHRL